MLYHSALQKQKILSADDIDVYNISTMNDMDDSTNIVVSSINTPCNDNRYPNPYQTDQLHKSIYVHITTLSIID